MSPETHRKLVGLIWDICNLLRGTYKRNEYRKVILPMTILRRFDCLLEPTKAKVRNTHDKQNGKLDAVKERQLRKASGQIFYNVSRLDFSGLLDDPDQIVPNLNGYIDGFSENVRKIMEKFEFENQIDKMGEAKLLYEVVKRFADVDLSAQTVDNIQMGYLFEELIRIGAEQSNEEAGEHFTPREVIRLMVNLLLSTEPDLGKSSVVKTIYDPACGTGGMLTVAEQYIRELNAEADPRVFGQELNGEAWAVCASDMLVKGENSGNIHQGNSFTEDAFTGKNPSGQPWTFDYMLANPPFGVEWKPHRKFIQDEHDQRGYSGRFGAGLPRVSDGSFLFLQHMLSKMRPVSAGGSRIGIVFNGSPLFTGSAGSGESEIRRWIIESDWLEAIVGLPDQLFYNTGISTYIWILTNRKEPDRAGRIHLIDARRMFVKMRKSLGNKRNKIGDPDDNPGETDQIAEIARIYADFIDQDTRTFTDTDPITKEPVKRKYVVSKILDNQAFGFTRVTVERPLRLRYQMTDEGRIRFLEQYPDREQDLDEIDEIFGREPITDWNGVWGQIRELLQEFGSRWKNPEKKFFREVFCERDPEAEPVQKPRSDSGFEPDPDLRDTESVPLGQNINEYFDREVLPHVPDAQMDRSKDRIGYEINFNRQFYRYMPPRSLEQIDHDIKKLKEEIFEDLGDIAK